MHTMKFPHDFPYKLRREVQNLQQKVYRLYLNINFKRLKSCVVVKNPIVIVIIKEYFELKQGEKKISMTGLDVVQRDNMRWNIIRRKTKLLKWLLEIDNAVYTRFISKIK